MQNTPTGSGTAAKIGAGAALLGTALIGPEGEIEDGLAAVDRIVTRATSAVGKEEIKVASEDAAKQAADQFLGPGAKPISGTRPWETGGVKGWVSADGQRVVRFAHTDTGDAKPHWNFINKVTGGNLHVYIK